MSDPIHIVPSGGGGDVLEVIPLGAGSEVGRSCCLVRFKGKSVMFDCGVHPAYSGLPSLPFFDEVDLDEIDLALITHFHLDHCAGLPYLLEKTNFNPKARIFMTHPTKAIYKALLSDFVRVTGHSGSSAENLYNEQDIIRTMERIESLDYHQEMTINGIRFWAYNAGHVLGAAMFMIEIAGVRVLYTGDFSRSEDRHLKEAEIPPYRPDVLIVESTYGVQIHEPRKVREARFTERVAQAVRRGGRVLLPVFALGRAQELLLILDEYWEAHPDLQEVPIYYASMLAKRCMTVYQTYINMMNDNVKKRYDVSNPFAFKYVSNLRGIDQFDDVGPSVVMASPGMLQSGLSRELFERWCTDKRNACILPGYSVDGTLAKHVLTEPATITRTDGKEVPLRCSVDYITFSAHSDFKQTSQFIDLSRPTNIVLVHGEAKEMGRLRLALDDRYNRGAVNKVIHLYTPKNGQVVQLGFRGDRIGKAIGMLPKGKPENGLGVSGVVVRHDFNYTIVKPEDLSKYTSIKISTIDQRLLVPLKRSFHVLLVELRRMFGGVQDGVNAETKRPFAVVGQGVTVEVAEDGGAVRLMWKAGHKSDMVADAISSLCLALNETVDQDPLSTEMGEDFLERALQVCRKMLSSRFGSVSLTVDESPTKSRLVVDLEEVIVDHVTLEVECENEKIRERVRLAARRIHAAAFPIPDYYCDCCACSTMDDEEQMGPDPKRLKTKTNGEKDEDQVMSDANKAVAEDEDKEAPTAVLEPPVKMEGLEAKLEVDGEQKDPSALTASPLEQSPVKLEATVKKEEQHAPLISAPTPVKTEPVPEVDDTEMTS